jgi:hypothetical protein
MSLYTVFRGHRHLGSFAKLSDAEIAIREDIADATCYLSRSDYNIEEKEVRKKKSAEAQAKFENLFSR